MENLLAFSIFSIATTSLSLHSPLAQAVPNHPKSFEQWCMQKDFLPAATKKTVGVLLKTAKTQDCKLADSKLNSLSELYLVGNQISDIKPIASLTNLTSLNLSFNQISDIKPLADLRYWFRQVRYKKVY